MRQAPDASRCGREATVRFGRWPVACRSRGPPPARVAHGPRHRGHSRRRARGSRPRSKFQGGCRRLGVACSRAACPSRSLAGHAPGARDAPHLGRLLAMPSHSASSSLSTVVGAAIGVALRHGNHELAGALPDALRLARPRLPCPRAAGPLGEEVCSRARGLALRCRTTRQHPRRIRRPPGGPGCGRAAAGRWPSLLHFPCWETHQVTNQLGLTDSRTNDTWTARQP